LQQVKKKVKQATKSSKTATIDTTLVDNSKFDIYSKYLREYEDLEASINKKFKEIPADVFT